VQSAIHNLGMQAAKAKKAASAKLAAENSAMGAKLAAAFQRTAAGQQAAALMKLEAEAEEATSELAGAESLLKDAHANVVNAEKLEADAKAAVKKVSAAAQALQALLADARRLAAGLEIGGSGDSAVAFRDSAHAVVQEALGRLRKELGEVAAVKEVRIKSAVQVAQALMLNSMADASADSGGAGDYEYD
jgi:hypothetical protein